MMFSFGRGLSTVYILIYFVHQWPLSLCLAACEHVQNSISGWQPPGPKNACVKQAGKIINTNQKQFPHLSYHWVQSERDIEVINLLPWNCSQIAQSSRREFIYGRGGSCQMAATQFAYLFTTVSPPFFFQSDFHSILECALLFCTSIMLLFVSQGALITCRQSSYQIENQKAPNFYKGVQRLVQSAVMDSGNFLLRLGRVGWRRFSTEGQQSGATQREEEEEEVKYLSSLADFFFFFVITNSKPDPACFNIKYSGLQKLVLHPSASTLKQSTRLMKLWFKSRLFFSFLWKKATQAATHSLS